MHPHVLRDSPVCIITLGTEFPFPQDEDFRADFGLPMLTEHDVDCIRSLG